MCKTDLNQRSKAAKARWSRLTKRQRREVLRPATEAARLANTKRA